jgi:hypothetical protein
MPVGFPGIREMCRVQWSKPNLIELPIIRSIPPSFIGPVVHALIDDVLCAIPTLLPLGTLRGRGANEICFDGCGHRDVHLAGCGAGLERYEFRVNASRIFTLVVADDFAHSEEDIIGRGVASLDAKYWGDLRDVVTPASGLVNGISRCCWCCRFLKRLDPIRTLHLVGLGVFGISNQLVEIQWCNGGLKELVILPTVHARVYLVESGELALVKL